VSRANWLFADTPLGAQTSATAYSLIGTVKANGLGLGLGPYKYLQHMLSHIGTADTLYKIEAQSPWNMPNQNPQ